MEEALLDSFRFMTPEQFIVRGRAIFDQVVKSYPNIKPGVDDALGQIEEEGNNARSAYALWKQGLGEVPTEGQLAQIRDLGRALAMARFLQNLKSIEWVRLLIGGAPKEPPLNMVPIIMPNPAIYCSMPGLYFDWCYFEGRGYFAVQ
ncbi:hypothetical protein M1271_06770 [Patescibacteria group bacterium]|nr:hypothetical protein [Patescibacteria group bacterium]